MKRLSCAALAVFTVLALPVLHALAAYDGSIKQNEAHSAEDSMYLYDIDISLTNPCNSGDVGKGDINEFWFDFTYKSENGYGASKTYRLDMSWNRSRNLNDEILKKTFLRPNDDACTTRFSVWVPGILEKVDVHLNMDGGERLAFEVTGIFLNGYRVNTDRDGVSSMYLDSNAKISCYTPAAAIVSADANIAYGTAKDQFGGLFTQNNRNNAVQQAKNGIFKLFYHHKCS